MFANTSNEAIELAVVIFLLAVIIGLLWRSKR
jgi:hypothetical protein